MTVQPLLTTMDERSFLFVDATLDVILYNSRGLNACKKRLFSIFVVEI